MLQETTKNFENKYEISDFHRATISAYHRTYRCLTKRIDALETDPEVSSAGLEKLVIEHTKALFKIRDQEKAIEKVRGEDGETASKLDLSAARCEILERLSRAGIKCSN